MTKTIADLLIKLGVDTKGFEKGFARAQKEMHRSFSTMAAIAGGSGLSGALIYSIKAAKDWGNAVDDIVDNTGAAGEEASKFLAIAQRTGITVEDGAGIMAKFGKATSTAFDALAKANAKGDESDDIFSRLGITLEEADKTNLYVTFQKVADKMRDMADGADKDRAAMELFGKSGYQLHDMLSMSAEEMQKVIDKADKMGLIISSETAAAWEQFDRNIGEITGTVNKLGISIGNELLPALDEQLSVAQKLIDSGAAWDDGQRKIASSAVVMAAEIGGVTVATKILQGIMSTFGLGVVNPWVGLAVATWAAYEALKAYGDEKARVTGYGGGGEIMMERTKDLKGGTNIRYYKKDSSTLSGYKYLNDDELALYQANQGSAPSMKGDASYLAAMNDPKKLAAQKTELDRKREIENKVATTLRGVSTGADAGKLQAKIEKMEELFASLDAKIMEVTGTQPAEALARLNSEIIRAQNDISEAANLGIDTSSVSKKLEEYQVKAAAEIAKNTLSAQKALATETASIKAQNLEDHKAIAEAEYQSTLVSLEQQRDAEYKKTGDMAAAEAWYTAQVEAANKKRTQSYIDADTRAFNDKMEHIANLNVLEGTSLAAIDQMNRQAIDSRIADLQVLLKNEKLGTDKRAEYEQELANRKRQIWEINGRDLATANQEAIREIMNQQYNYKDAMVDTWNSINSATSGHFRAMVTGAESMSEGIEGTMHDLKDAIIGMFVDMAYQQYILGPLKSWFSGILGGTSSSASTLDMGKYGITSLGVSYPQLHANGGLADGWSIVGERGPELVNFAETGRVYTANQTRGMLSGAQTSGGPVTVNLYDKSGENRVVQKQARFDRGLQEMVVDLWIDARERNVGGLRDVTG